MRNLFLLICLIAFLPSNAQNHTKWQEWQQSACYHKIEFRVKLERTKGKRMEWNIQFRNKYEDPITFNYGITEDSQDYLTNMRKTLQAKEVSPPASFFTQTADFYVLLDKLSFSLYNNGKFIPCD